MAKPENKAHKDSLVNLGRLVLLARKAKQGKMDWTELTEWTELMVWMAVPDKTVRTELTELMAQTGLMVSTA